MIPMIRWLMQLEPLDAMVSEVGGADAAEDTTAYRVYTCFDSPEPFDKPTLMLSTDGFQFQFIFSLLSSYIPIGTYELNDTQLILRTDDELERIYVFDIVGDTYVFNASLSSRIPTYQYKSGGDSKCPVPDGAIFASKAQGEAQEVASETIDEPLPAETTAGPIEITNYYERIPMPIDETYDPFEDAVAEAIHARYRPDDPDGLIHTESHVVLANAIACGVGLFGAEEKGVSEEILYTIVMHKRYSTYGGELKEEGGSIVPTYLRFRIEDHGKITLLEYWEPRDGRYYADDVRNTFPDFAADDALNHQQYVTQLDAQCRSKALAILQNAGRIDDHIASLLEIICSSPAYASDPAAYIKAHDVEFAELINYSQYTLRYCFSQFIQGMQTDLRGHIMAAVCKEILSELGEPFTVASTPISTGQDWFDAFRIHAQETIEQYDIEYLEKYCPGTFLYLNLVKEV